MQKGEKDFLLSASDVSVGPLSLRAFSLLAPAFLFSIVKSGLSSPRNQLQTASQTMAKESDDPSMQLRSVGVEFRCLHLLHSTEAVTTPSLQRAMLPMSDTRFRPPSGVGPGIFLIRSKDNRRLPPWGRWSMFRVCWRQETLR